MQRRSPGNNYSHPGYYHITITISNRRAQSLGRIVGDLQYPDGHPDAPKVELTAIGKMVEYELRHSISRHYPVVEVQDYVVMPEHIHFILHVKNSIISKNGRETHLGQIIAGFKKGCNRRYWEIIGLTPNTPPSLSSSASASIPGSVVGSMPTSVSGSMFPAVSPQGPKAPSSASSGRPALFSSGYVDIIPLKEGQLDTQRAYIHSNPRNRLLRITNRSALFPQRNTIDTLVTPSALKGYLTKEHALRNNDTTTWNTLHNKLTIANSHVLCDSYGSLDLLTHRLLPVVCHRLDKPLFAQQKAACLNAAQQGAVLVSPRIAAGEQEIIDEAIALGFPVALIIDNGFPAIYHPSESRLALCASAHMLLITPWTYHYRHNNQEITVAECKTMNCIAQAICRTKDSWWK
ncbi:hypothetical protein SAMN06298211_101262 [Prevotellaceae bacterium MN60]|nr:hypothetical protein SAMN06298211_101262 [Prevotellaceae bacterium MN60]